MLKNTYNKPHIEGINPVKEIYERGEEVSIVTFLNCFGTKDSYPHDHTLYTYYRIDGTTYGQSHSIKTNKEETISKSVTFTIPLDAKTVKFKTTKNGPWIPIQLTDPLRPTEPKFINPTSYLHENSFKLEWSSVDFYKSNGRYELQKRINNGDWTEVSNNLDHTYYDFDIKSISRGDLIDFRVRAINNIGISSWSTISFKRNSIPNVVTNVLPSGGFATNQIEIRWTAAQNSDNKILKYNIYINKNKTEYKKVATVSNCSYLLTIPSEDNDGSTYSIKIETIDNFNCINSIIGPTYVKPEKPIAPNNLGPNSGYYESYIDFSWTMPNNYSMLCKNILEIFIDNELYKTEIISGADTKYRLFLSDIKRDCDISYRIKTIDTFGRESKWIKCENTFKHNNIPNKPSIVLPLESKKIYGKTPLFVFKTSTDIDKQDTILKVKIGDITYDSINYEMNFSKKIINNEEYVIFKPAYDLDIGKNNISLYTSDGLIDGDAYSITLDVLEKNNPFVLGECITADSLNTYIKMLNVNLDAYGLELCNISIKKGSSVSSDIINSIIKKIEELNSVFNQYHLDNNIVTPTYFIPTKKDITAASYDIFNKLFNSLY